jgi:hypothetical protein
VLAEREAFGQYCTSTEHLSPHAIVKILEMLGSSSRRFGAEGL